MENTSKSNMQSARLLPFDPIVLVQDVLKRWLVVVLAALAVGIGTYIYTDATYAPVYRTTTTFVVTTRGSSTSVYSNLSSTSNLAGLFTELLNSSIMRKTILQETDISSFDGTIDTAVVPNTNLITMTVTDADPRMAFLAAQAIIEHHESLTYQVIDDIGLEVLQYPAVPTSPTNQNFAFHQMKKAAVIAALAATALLAILSYLRDAVRSGTEAREKLDCSYLGEISHERKYKTVFALLRRKKTSILITNPRDQFPVCGEHPQAAPPGRAAHGRRQGADSDEPAGKRGQVHRGCQSGAGHGAEGKACAADRLRPAEARLRHGAGAEQIHLRS